MRVDAGLVRSRCCHYALVSVLAGAATWLLVLALRNERSLHSGWAWLFALLATLIAFCFVVRRGMPEPPVTSWLNPWVFPAACSAVALALSVAGFNGSSSAQILAASDGVAPSCGVVLGQAKFIRSDEWIMHTPWLLSQAKQVHPFSSRNPSVGGKQSPLVCNLPVAHWSLCFRPEFWPFFSGLRAESAFAFFWNFKWWSLLCGSYALLLIVTRGDSLLSAGGALILFWTATVQWWFSSPTLMPDMLGLWCFALAAAFGAIVHERRWPRVLLSMTSAFCALGFLFCCYPPFQIPLLTLFAPLLLALVFDRPTVRHWTPIVAATGLVILGAAVFVWQLRDTLLTISRLVYPGQRFSTGGGVPWASMVYGFLTLGASELHYPKNFDNVVAASSFVNVLPLLACVYVARCRQREGRDVTQWVLLGFAAVTTLFAVCGFPRFLAKISLWSYVTTERVSIALALVGILAICRYLSLPARRQLIGLGWRTVLGAVVFGVVLVVANRELHNFVGPATLVSIWLFYSVAGWFLVARYRFACIAMILFPLAFLNAAINPLSRGIPAYNASKLSPLFNQLRREFPRNRWIVVGPNPQAESFSALLKAAGATVLSGIIAVPNQAMLDRLDPKHQNTMVYARYATLYFQPATDQAVEPVFELRGRTAYSVQLPLTEQWLRPAGIDGVIVLDAPNLPVPENYREVSNAFGCRVWVASP
jgi:hypothetical protein